MGRIEGPPGGIRAYTTYTGTYRDESNGTNEKTKTPAGP